MLVDNLVCHCREIGGSDIHIAVGRTPRFRVYGEVKACEEFSEVVTKSDLNDFVSAYFGDAVLGDSFDNAATIRGIRCRIAMFLTETGKVMTLRLMMDELPILKELGLPKQVEQFLEPRAGLILIAGSVGSGKTTTIAALLDYYNKTYNKVILTMEDPIEYQFVSKSGFIYQRQVGRDVASYEEASIQALRQDANIIMLGELRTQTTIEQAILLAETGHLVIATVHTKSAESSMERVAGAFPAETRDVMVSRLSDILRGVVFQRLIPGKEGGRVVFASVITLNGAIRANLKKHEMAAVRDAMRVSNESYSDIESATDLLESGKADWSVIEPYLCNEDAKAVADKLHLERKLI